MTKPIVWSIDDGYGDIKAYNGQPIGKIKEDEKLNSYEYFQRTGLLLIPSYVTTYRPKPVVDLEDGEKEDPFSYIAVTYNGRKYIVGQGAIDQDSRATWVGGNNKHKDYLFPVILATTLGLLASQEKSMVDLLSMGLPVEVEEDPKRRELLEKLVLKLHEIEIELADGTKFKRETYVKDLDIKKQPFGSLCDVILDNEGNISDKEIAAGYNVIGDIGARTLNVFTLNALEPVRDLCFQTNDGMFEAYKLINTYIREKTGSFVAEGKLPSIIATGKVQGKDIIPDKEYCYQIHSNTISNQMDTRLANSWAVIDRIIWTGGGGEQLKSNLEDMFDEVQQIFLNRFSTAIGLRKQALRNYKRSKATKASEKDETVSAS
ncbi:ParM/StbA family protein [Paenibacillus alvei]|uniref:ParM/StbA family protein n=1 Tax=Paenibacillus alvei TaxID=44250 RepID=UPI002281B970|nr:ParM/StbA family protein [Paenibacillus alvei]MCY9738195.1 ParM/StbA family protein [Paenibacillus alvei]